MVCFSKGLGAPVGSVVAGPAAWTAEVRRERKRFGGGMRQAGILAAACLHALDHHRERLAEDHANARVPGGARGRDPGDRSRPGAVETNIVVIDLTPTGQEVPAVLGRLRERGVLMVPFGPGRIRAVTHLDVDRRAVGDAAVALAAAIGR